MSKDQCLHKIERELHDVLCHLRDINARPEGDASGVVDQRQVINKMQADVLKAAQDLEENVVQYFIAQTGDKNKTYADFVAAEDFLQDVLSTLHENIEVFTNP